MLWVTSQPVSFLAFIGLTSLMVIVINNGILPVDEGNQLRSLLEKEAVVVTDGWSGRSELGENN